MANRIVWDQQIGRRLKLRDLHVFLTVAHRGSMAKAAAELGVSQPVVSAVVADLEHAIGVRLFDRSARGVEPNLYGRALLKGGVVAFDELKQTVKEIEFLVDPTAGEVRVGCPETVSAILPPVFERLFQRYPRMVFEIYDVVAPTLDLPQLRDRTLDVALLRIFWSPPHHPFGDDLNVEELFDDETLVVAGAESPWARRRKIDLAELQNEPWILPPAVTTNSKVVMEAFRARGLEPPKVSMITYSVSVRTNLMAKGRYLSVFPRSMMNLYAKQMGLKVLPVKLAVRKWPVVIVTLKNRTLSPATELFIDHVRSAPELLGADLRHTTG